MRNTEKELPRKTTAKCVNNLTELTEAYRDEEIHPRYQVYYNDDKNNSKISQRLKDSSIRVYLTEQFLNWSDKATSMRCVCDTCNTHKTLDNVKHTGCIKKKFTVGKFSLN